MEALVETSKHYHEFFKANIENLDCLNVAEMKVENLAAGTELEKLVSNLKELLSKPHGKKPEPTIFNPLDLQKDLPDNKGGAAGKPNAFNFLNKGKENGTNGTQSNGNDLLGIDLLAGPTSNTVAPQTATPAGSAAATNKPNALNFLAKKQPATTPGVQTTGQTVSGGLLDLDLSAGVSTTQTVAGSGMTGGRGVGIPPQYAGSQAGANFDLLDLSVGTEPIAAPQTKQGITMNSNLAAKPQKNQAELDLMNLMGDFGKP